MPSLEVQIENAKKAVKVAKDALQKAKPAGQSQRDFENGMNMFPNDYSDGVKAKKKLEAAESRLRLLQDRKKKGGKTRRPKRGSNKTLRRV